MFAFAGARALALALAFSFMLVLQAATPKTTVAAAASNSISLVFIFASSLEKGIKGNESPASPFAGDPFAQILDGLAYFAAGPANFLLNVSFNPFVYASLLQVGVARQLTKFLFRGALHLLAFPFKFVFVSHCFPPSVRS